MAASATKKPWLRAARGMREAVLVVALVLAAPLAAALPPFARLDAPGARVELLPERDVSRIGVNLTVSCAIVANGADVALAVEGAPAWVRAFFAPARARLAPDACVGVTETRVEALLVLQATLDAPALRPASFEIVARVVSLAGAYDARAPAQLTARWFNALQPHVPQATALLAPGATQRLPVTLENQGNGALLVRVEATSDDPRNLTVDPVAPVALESRQEAGPAARTNASFDVVLHARAQEGSVSRVGVVTVLLSPARRDAPQDAGEPIRVSFVVTTRDEEPLAQKLAPDASPLLAAGFVALAAWARRR